MKSFLKIIAFLVILVIFAAAVLVFTLPKERIKAEIQTAFHNATGRDLDFNDDVGLSFYPDLGIVLNDVTVSNASWSDEKFMARIGKLDVVLALKPLLSREIVIERFVLNEPVIFLQVNAAGEGNWQFMSDDTDKSATPSQDIAEKSAPPKLTLSAFQIKDGRLVYTNAAEKLREEFTDVDFVINAEDLKGEVEVEGDMAYRGQEIALEASLESLEAAMAGNPTPAEVEIETAAALFDFEGIYAPSKDVLLSGAVLADIRSLPQLMTLLNRSAEGNLPIQSFKLKMNGTVKKDGLQYEKMEFASDVLEASGKGHVAYGGKKPFFGGVYKIEALNLDMFKSVPSSPAADKPAKEEAKPAPAKGWDTTPIDYGFLKSVNMDITANVAGYAYDGLKFGANTLQLEILDGVMEMNISDTPAFGGKVNKTVILNAAKSPPTLRADAKAENIDAQQFLGYFADSDKLSGRMDATFFNITANANSMAEIAHTLDGTVDVMFSNGEIKGIDFVNWAKSFQSRLSSVDESYGSTKFVSLGGKFSIENGIVKNNNLKLEGPLADVKGSGTANIPNKTLDYRLVVTLAPAAQAEGSLTAGIDMPFTVTGSWSDPKIRPDLAGLVKKVLTDPKAAEQQLQNLEEVGKALEDSFKGEKNAIKSLKGLIESF